MEIHSAPGEMNKTHAAVVSFLNAVIPEGAGLNHIPRLDFYARARRTYTVVHTSENIPFSCFNQHNDVIFEFCLVRLSAGLPLHYHHRL